MALNLAEANRAIAAALAKATELGQKVSVTVCDADGHLVGHQRMDGVFAEASRGSIGKAVAAAELGRPSGDDWKETMEHSRTSTVTAAGAPNIRTRGGLPIIRNGEVEGAIGVSGAGTNEQDEECARAAIGVLGIEPQEHNATKYLSYVGRSTRRLCQVGGPSTLTKCVTVGAR